METNDQLLSDLNSLSKYDFFNNNPLLNDPDIPNPYENLLNSCKYFDFSAFTSSPLNSTEPIFLSTNIQCLQSKFENLKHYILSLTSNNIPITIIALQETWQIPHHADIIIPGFKFIHASRKNAKGGGIGYFIKK